MGRLVGIAEGRAVVMGIRTPVPLPLPSPGHLPSCGFGEGEAEGVGVTCVHIGFRTGEFVAGFREVEGMGGEVYHVRDFMRGCR